MVEERALRLGRVSLVELDVRPADLDPGYAGWACPVRGESERSVLLCGLVGMRREQRDVVEVVIHLRLALDEAQTEPFVQVEVRLAFPRTAQLDAVLQAGERSLEIRHAERNVLEVTSLARAFLREQGQLAATRVRADQREVVRSVDDVHAEVLRDEVGDPIPLRDPQRHVIEGQRLHHESIVGGAQGPSHGGATYAGRRRAGADPCSSSSGLARSSAWPRCRAAPSSGPSAWKSPSAARRGGPTTCPSATAETTLSPRRSVLAPC